jgi:DNA-binding CsgD family transcriptional regulator
MAASLTTNDISNVLEFLRDLYAIDDVRLFPCKVITSLSKIVPSDIITYNDINLAEQRHAIVVDPPEALAFPDSHQIFDQHLDEHPLIGHYARTADSRALKISDFLTRRMFHNTGLHTDFFRRVGVEHQMAFILPARRGLLTGIALNRKGRDFNERNRVVLNLVRPHLVQAYRNAEAVTRLRSHARLVLRAVELCQGALILLGRERNILRETNEALRLLAKYFPDHSPATQRLPDTVERWARHHQETLHGTGVPRRWTPLVVERESSRLVVRIITDHQGSLLILEERFAAIEPDMHKKLALSSREVEVLGWVTQGKTNADIAAILALSPRTVQKHMEHIFRKLGVETRTAAVFALNAQVLCQGLEAS